MLGQQDLPSALTKSNSAGPTINILQPFFLLIFFFVLGLYFAYVQDDLRIFCHNKCRHGGFIFKLLGYRKWSAIKGYFEYGYFGGYLT